MRIPEPSISEREAEALYPTQHREGTKVVRMLDRDTDDLQQAYMRGREAEPCEEQVDAATKQTIILCHGNQAKRATSVCLDCIKRFGFKPIVTVTPEYYEKLLDAADRGMAVKEVTE